MADVFLSYKREDKATAERLGLSLGQLGFDVWWDFELLSGDKYRKVIREVINQCPAAIVLWSTLAIESDFVMDEATHAKSLGKLCPARIDGVELPFGFGQVHTDDLRGWDGELSHPGFQALVRSLEERIGRKGKLGQARRTQEGQAAAAELDAFKAAQLAGNESALRSFLRTYPRGAFASFVRNQVESMKASAAAGAPAPAPAPMPAPAPAPTPEPAAQPLFSGFSGATTATPSIASRAGAQQKSNPWPMLALGAILVAAGAVSVMIFQGGIGRAADAAPTEIASTSPNLTNPATTPTEPPRDVEAEIEAARLEERNRTDDNAFNYAKSTDTVAAYDGYLSAWPQGRNVDAVRTARTAADKRERAAATAAAAQLSANERAARDKADDSTYAVAKRGNTIASYDAYLAEYPYGRNASSARSLRNTLANPPAPIYGAHDLNQLHSSVKSAAESARIAKSRGEGAAARARDAAAKADDAARRARNGESGYEVTSDANEKFYIQSSVHTASGGYGIGESSTGNFAGDRRAGQWRNSLFAGVGVYTYGTNPNNTSESQRYEGEYANGTMNGVGVYTWRDGRRHLGGERDGLKIGFGVFEWPDGYRYEGDWANDKRSGYGVLWGPDGKINQAGIWANDALSSSLTK